MNLYEKEKYLKFCERSVVSQGKNSIVTNLKNPKNTILTDFRYQMSFEPYNSFYLPLVVSQEDLQFWDASVGSATEDITSRDLFLKTCLLNFDEKSYTILQRYNSHYINEFMSIVGTNP
jgi:hypothetical protein